MVTAAAKVVDLPTTLGQTVETETERRRLKIWVEPKRALDMLRHELCFVKFSLSFSCIFFTDMFSFSLCSAEKD